MEYQDVRYIRGTMQSIREIVRAEPRKWQWDGEKKKWMGNVLKRK